MDIPGYPRFDWWKVWKTHADSDSDLGSKRFWARWVVWISAKMAGSGSGCGSGCTCFCWCWGCRCRRRRRCCHFFLLFCCYCSCCYGCCCFLIQMMMLRFIHSPVQTSATDPCPVSKVLRGQATYQPSAMSTNSNCSIIEQMAVPGCMHFFLPESDITFRSWLEHPPQCARGHQGMQALTLNTCGKACRYQGERARPALAVGFLSCLSNSWFRYVLFLLQLSLFLF